MCILSQIKDLLSSNSIISAVDVVTHISQLFKWYEQNAADPKEASKKDAFIDALISLLQQEKSK